MNRKRISLLLVTVAILSLFVLLYCISEQDAEAISETSVYVKDDFLITKADLHAATDGATALSFDQAEEDYIIDEGGKYLLSGELQGTLYIDVEDQHVHLILNNMAITGIDGPAISVLSAGKVFITSMENTENSLGDSAAYELKRTEEACIHCPSDLTFNGTGSLLITGLFEDAVYCKATLKVLSSNLKVQAKRDCLRGNDGVFIQGNSITLEAERNGIRTTNSGKDARGDVEIRDANLSVIAGNYCVISASDFYVHQSDCFFKGILGAHQVAGEMLVEEECLSYA